MSNLQPFQFGDTEIRFVGTADKPEWVAADIIAVLYPESQATDRPSYLRPIPKQYKGKKKISTPYTNTEKKDTMRSSHTGSTEKDVITVNEPGLYWLLARSNSPIAVPFQKWVFEEVLPSIRKTGGYGVFREFNHPILTLTEAVALTEVAALAEQSNKGSVHVIDGICSAIDPKYERFTHHDIGMKIVKVLSAMDSHFCDRNMLADALIVMPERLETFINCAIKHLESCPNQQSDWREIAHSVPYLEDYYGAAWGAKELPNDSHLAVLIHAVLDRIEKQGRGRWITPKPRRNRSMTPTIFQLND